MAVGISIFALHSSHVQLLMNPKAHGSISLLSIHLIGSFLTGMLCIYFLSHLRFFIAGIEIDCIRERKRAIANSVIACVFSYYSMYAVSQNK